MAANDGACKNRDMALAILRTITEGMKAGTQKTALESVTEWVQRASFEKLPDSPEERRRLADRLWRDLRDGRRFRMTVEERKAEAAFYLEGIN